VLQSDDARDWYSSQDVANTKAKDVAPHLEAGSARRRVSLVGGAYPLLLVCLSTARR
jgi:hypothetical protein